MRNKLKFILLSCLLIAAVLLVAGCSSDLSPFGGYDKDGYTVSVKFDANGGVFTTNTETIMDTYSLEGYKVNSEGNAELKLFAPDASERGKQAYTATKADSFLAGWYAERTEVKDADGKVTGYTYAKPWDFAVDRLTVKADGQYSAKEAELTLYAAWVPAFTYEFYVLDSAGGGVLIGNMAVNPLSESVIKLPYNDSDSGKVGSPGDLPALTGKTYDKVYLNADKTGEITTATLAHSGRFIKETATLENPTMMLYCTTLDGVFYNISKAEQLVKAPNLSANYTLTADLDFEGKTWPALFTAGEFKGKLIGNGHTIKNVKLTQNNSELKSYGLFGTVSQSAEISDVTFDSISVTLSAYSKYQNTAYGIFTGEISDGAQISGVTLSNSTLFITKSISLQSALNSFSPKFGLVCAEGDISGVSFAPENVKSEFTGEYKLDCILTPASDGKFNITVTAS